ncbi:DUF5985 family protein [Sandaracinus amylolyticus]|uniref:Uncharacterized protein n=1 Tax=Sandaracinus amylolyticus TaxID=927083 RepID=A0A0F6W2B1_9BACT|nr:DUF5985 family protein [Sandaracinus amylolyticus]AKF05693.1 hypothetical protein DB32_002842 [Sandaracinus amylolyticus]
MIEHLRDLLYGALTMASIVASLAFLRFWRESRDRFFVMFSAAFALLAVNWVAVAFVPADYEARALVYLVRLSAFLIIIGAIVDKNRASQ